MPTGFSIRVGRRREKGRRQGRREGMGRRSVQLRERERETASDLKETRRNGGELPYEGLRILLDSFQDALLRRDDLLRLRVDDVTRLHRDNYH
jgi:hypothetical protein